ncbi:unnamed protein product [Arabis nemorensis]|uniref:Thioredoxin domain-containing protein n=1 Tax=Arabis nemorensis TaxID=586526 RepID=A0A565BGE2_9BRAS|nr:unnamed protein product [Arabis nemorensis]
MCSEPSDAMIKTYVSSSLPSNDDLDDHSAMLKVVHDVTAPSEWDDVMRSKLPVMVLFTNKRCGVKCESVRNILSRLDLIFEDTVKFYTVNTDEQRFIPPYYEIDVYSLPTSVVYKDGWEMERVIDEDDPSLLEKLARKYI